MTNLKRALSLVLVLALALSMVVMSTSAAKFSDVKSSYAYSTEVQFLSDLGILNGYTDGTYKPEGIITRAEAAAVIYRMLSGKTSAANYAGETKFPDVTAAHWASGYVNFAVELGVVAGYPDGNFYPDQTLTYGEYTTMLVRALGLDKGKDPSYPFGYIALASVEGVNLGVDLQAKDACPRGPVAKLTYNSILDATYARMANNIYVTEKPTIAKNILKLESMEGVLTSTGKYDFVGANPAGTDKFRVSNVSATSLKSVAAIGGDYIGEYAVAVTDLGKKAKIWYKPDAATASGDKVYAVIIEDAIVTSTIHILLKGNFDATKHELTYVVGDEDKTYKFSDTCKFISNNEYLGSSTTADPYEDTFYPSTLRMWLPIAYTFIDNDKDGKYDFAIRKTFGFAKVANMSTTKFQVDGQPQIDRKDDAGNAYAWDASLKDIAVDDYVLYYADGKTALMANPSFTSTLYKDTYNASFTKIAKATGTLESIIDGDKYVLGGKTYRTMSVGGSNPDLIPSAELLKEYEYYPLASFGIVAKSELTNASSGKYVVIKQTAAASIGDNFDISAINEAGKEEVYTVKGSTSSNLTVYNKTAAKITMPLGGDIAAGMSKSVPLTLANVNSVVTSNAPGSALYEYTMDSTGKISTLKSYVVTAGATIAPGDLGYNNTSKLIISSNATYLVDDATLIYVYNSTLNNYKVYTGGFPKILDANATTTVESADVKTDSGTNKLRAMYISTDASSMSGSSSKSGVSGYLRNASVVNADGKWFYKYGIAYGGDVAATYNSKTADSFADLATVLADEALPANASNLGGVVTFDINNDGTISNLIQKKTIANADSVDGKYYGTRKVIDVDTTNRIITLATMTGTPVTAGARVTGSTAPDRAVIGTTDATNANVTIGAASAYRYASNVNVYVFDTVTTFQAGVTAESIGSVQKSTATDTYMVSFAYDVDNYVITDIFFNKYAVALAGSTVVTPPVTVASFGYYDAAGTAVTTLSQDTTATKALTVKLVNSSTANISIAATDTIETYYYNKTTGATSATTSTATPALTLLPNTTGTVGTYTIPAITAAGSYQLVTKLKQGTAYTQTATLDFTVTPATASIYTIANIAGHVSGTPVTVTIKATDAAGNTNTSYAKTQVVTLTGPVSYSQSVTFAAGVGTLTIPAATAGIVATGTTGAITATGADALAGTFTVTTVSGAAAAMSIATTPAIQYVPANLTLTAINDANANNITAGNYAVTVVSDKDGSVFSGTKAVAGGAIAAFPITLTTAGTHTLTVTAAGFTKTATVVITADTTAPALDAAGIDAATINSKTIVIGTATAANTIFDAGSGVKTVVINLAGVNYTGTVNAAGTSVTFTGLPTVTAGASYTITLTDKAGNVNSLVTTVQ